MVTFALILCGAIVVPLEPLTGCALTFVGLCLLRRRTA